MVFGALAIGAYALVTREKEGSAKVQEASMTETKGDAATDEKKMSFESFVANYGDGSYRCEVDQYLSDMDTEGVVYLDGEKLRGDFTAVAEGRSMKMSFIQRDGVQYLWQNGGASGMKLSVEAIANGSGNAQGTYAWDATQIGQYDCQPWSADAAVFALPGGVVFTDISAMVKPQ